MAVRTTYRVGYTALVSVPHRASPSSAGSPHLTAYHPLLVHRHETSHPPSFRPLLAEGTLELATVPATRPVGDFHPSDTPHAGRTLDERVGQRVQLQARQDDWEHVYDDVWCLRTKGNLDRTWFIFGSDSRRDDVLLIYRRNTKRDWDGMVNLRQALDKGKKPRKKYRVSNVLVDTHPHCRFPLAFASQEAAVEKFRFR